MTSAVAAARRRRRRSRGVYIIYIRTCVYGRRRGPPTSSSYPERNDNNTRKKKKKTHNNYDKSLEKAQGVRNSGSAPLAVITRATVDDRRGVIRVYCIRVTGSTATGAQNISGGAARSSAVRIGGPFQRPD